MGMGSLMGVVAIPTGGAVAGTGSLAAGEVGIGSLVALATGRAGTGTSFLVAGEVGIPTGGLGMIMVTGSPMGVVAIKSGGAGTGSLVA